MNASTSRVATRLARQLQLPCTCSSTSSHASVRAISTSAARPAMLKAEKLAKANDPLDMANLEDFQYNDMPMEGHRMVEQDRERLHLLRLIEFQLPEVQRSLRRRYIRPSPDQVVTVQTQYNAGDPSHPSSRKAVITVSIRDILSGTSALQSEKAQHKFKLLAGPRWDPDTDEIKISCDNFPTLNMNTKWCSDALDRLIKEAEDTKDSMADIALDKRHAEVRKIRKRGKRGATLADFPQEWLRDIKAQKELLPAPSKQGSQSSQ